VGHGERGAFGAAFGDVSGCGSCTTGASHSLDTEGNVGRHSSVAISDDGNPIVSYYDDDQDDLKVARAQFAVSGIIFE
jgi:hypothetical protein